MGKWENVRKKITEFLHWKYKNLYMCHAQHLSLWEASRPPLGWQLEGQATSSTQGKSSPGKLRESSWDLPGIATLFRKGTNGHQAPVALFSSWYSLLMTTQCSSLTVEKQRLTSCFPVTCFPVLCQRHRIPQSPWSSQRSHSGRPWPNWDESFQPRGWGCRSPERQLEKAWHRDSSNSIRSSSVYVFWGFGHEGWFLLPCRELSWWHREYGVMALAWKALGS